MITSRRILQAWCSLYLSFSLLSVYSVLGAPGADHSLLSGDSKPDARYLYNTEIYLQTQSKKVKFSSILRPYSIGLTMVDSRCCTKHATYISKNSGHPPTAETTSTFKTGHKIPSPRLTTRCAPLPLSAASGLHLW